MLKFKNRLNRKESAKFCSNCGAKVSKNEKFCPNCGQAISGRGLLKSQPGVKGPKLWRLITLLLAVIFFGAIFGFLYMIPEGSTAASGLLVVEILAAGMFILGIIQLYRYSYKILQNSTKLRVVVVGLTLGFIPFFFGYVISGVYYGHRLQMMRYDNFINNYLVDAETAKLAGDQLKTDAELKKVIDYEKVALKELNQLTPPRSMSNYHAAAVHWLEDLAAVKTTQQWHQVSGFPNYQVNVSGATENYLLDNAFSDINDIRPFGDMIVANGTTYRGNMTFIASRLTVETGLLEALSHSHKLCLSRNSSDICTDKVIASTKAAASAAADYAIDKDHSGEGWNTATKGLIKLLQSAGYKQAYTIAGTQAEDTNMTVAPRVDNFWAGCYELKGNALNPTAKTRLPTLEYGYNCYYKVNNEDCWAFLTLSGREFGGSSNGADSINCKQQNLPSAPTITNHKFDGTYSIYTSGASCSTGEATDLFAENRTSSVKDNEVDQGSSNQIPLDGSGYGGISNTQAAAKLTYSEQYDQFGTMQGFWKVETDQGNCAGSFVGLKH